MFAGSTRLWRVVGLEVRRPGLGFEWVGSAACHLDQKGPGSIGTVEVVDLGAVSPKEEAPSPELARPICAGAPRMLHRSSQLPELRAIGFGQAGKAPGPRRVEKPSEAVEARCATIALCLGESVQGAGLRLTERRRAGPVVCG